MHREYDPQLDQEAQLEFRFPVLHRVKEDSWLDVRQGTKLLEVQQAQAAFLLDTHRKICGTLKMPYFYEKSFGALQGMWDKFMYAVAPQFTKAKDNKSSELSHLFYEELTESQKQGRFFICDLTYRELNGLSTPKLEEFVDTLNDAQKQEIKSIATEYHFLEKKVVQGLDVIFPCGKVPFAVQYGLIAQKINDKLYHFKPQDIDDDMKNILAAYTPPEDIEELTASFFGQSCILDHNSKKIDPTKIQQRIDAVVADKAEKIWPVYLVERINPSEFPYTAQFFEEVTGSVLPEGVTTLQDLKNWYITQLETFIVRTQPYAAKLEVGSSHSAQ